MNRLSCLLDLPRRTIFTVTRGNRIVCAEREKERYSSPYWTSHKPPAVTMKKNGMAKSNESPRFTRKRQNDRSSCAILMARNSLIQL